MRPRILIVDDHDGFRAVARALLEDEGFDIVGEAADAAGAVVAASTLRPGIVLLDAQLPDADGFAASQQLAALPARRGLRLPRPMGHRARDFEEEFGKVCTALGV